MRTFTYNAALQVHTESIDGSGGGLYSKVITRDYEDGSNYTVEGRDAGFHIGTEYIVTYSYDNDVSGGTGRFKKITGPGLPDGGAVYSYVTTSDLIEKHEFRNGSDSPLAAVTRDYEEHRDLLKAIENVVDPQGTPETVSKYNYHKVNDAGGYDELGRRKSVVYTGSAFGAGHHNDYDYNNRSELTEADRKTGTTPDGGTPMTPGDYDYLYDNIGNRETYTLDTATTAYTANDLNQYADVDPPGETPEEYLCYNDDGNLIRDGKANSTCPGTDGLFAYTWDAENRLISVGPVSTPVNNNKKLEFKYDYMGRRVEKVYSVYNVPDQDPDAWVEQSRQRFVYDGWNVVLVLDDNNDTVRKYTWGPDMSQTIHGAGGIGGLLACVATGGAYEGSYWFLYDGNGNVGQILDATDHDPPADITVAARYEYDPYGNQLPIPQPPGPGPYATVNPMRFSTKWFDDELAGTGVNGAVGESGLGYWGYRYYSPRLGRWLNRDPIGEDAGLNLYEYVRNSPIGGLDFAGLGLYSFGDGWGPNHPAFWTAQNNRTTWGTGAAGARASLASRTESWLGLQQLLQGGRFVANYQESYRMLRHYKGNSGSGLSVNYNKMLRADIYARGHFYDCRRAG